MNKKDVSALTRMLQANLPNDMATMFGITCSIAAYLNKIRGTDRQGFVNEVFYSGPFEGMRPVDRLARYCPACGSKNVKDGRVVQCLDCDQLYAAIGLNHMYDETYTIMSGDGTKYHSYTRKHAEEVTA